MALTFERGLLQKTPRQLSYESAPFRFPLVLYNAAGTLGPGTVDSEEQQQQVDRDYPFTDQT